MTISNSSNSVTFAANGAQQSFSFNFIGVSASDIAVSTISPNGTITPLTSSQYTISLNAPVTGQLWGVGGTLITGSVYSTGTSISMLRTLPLTQPTSVQNQGNYYAQVTEQALDTLCMEIQQVNTMANNAIQIPSVDTGINTVLPAAAARANQYLAFDNNGNVLTTAGAATGTIVSSAMAPVVSASSLSAGRAAFGVAASGANTDITSLNAPALGAATATTQSASDNTTHVATTAQVQAAISAAAGGGGVIPSQVRLSLSSSAAVQTSDIVGASTIYSLPYNGQNVPVYNGTTFTYQNCGSLSLVLNSSNHTAGGVYDVYVSVQSGNPVLSTMYWGGTGSRSTTAGGKTQTGNASVTTKNGVLVNNAAISTVDSFNGTTGYAIPQYQGTLLGSFYTTNNGQTGVNLRPAAISGGGTNAVGLCNAYNRVRICSYCADNSTWTYNTSAWRPTHNSTGNRVTYVDPLQQIFTRATVSNYLTSGATPNYEMGVALNSISNTPNIWAHSVVNNSSLFISESFLPQLGLNYIQSMENGEAGNNTLNGDNNEVALIVDLEF